jgi:uroporphyrinogen decarboxylase
MMLSEYFGSLGRIGAVPILGYPGLRTEGITAEECLLNPVLHSRVVRSNLDRFHPDAALPLLDLTVEAECYGLRAGFKDRDPPELSFSIPLMSWAERETSERNRIPLMIDTARIISAQISDVPVGFYVTGPFTVAGQIVGIQNLLPGLTKARGVILDLLNSCTATVVDYASRLKDTEVDFLVIADPTSSLISPEHFDDFAKTSIVKVVKAFSRDSVLHVCGRSGHLLKQMVETGVAGLSLDDHVKLRDAVNSVPDDVVVLGNYSITSLADETPETIIAEVSNMLSGVDRAVNVVASTGCDISASTPPANIDAFIQGVKSYKADSV